MTMKHVVLEINDQFKATDQGQTMEIGLGWSNFVIIRNAHAENYEFVSFSEFGTMDR